VYTTERLWVSVTNEKVPETEGEQKKNDYALQQ
jgi:hypothetical protein